MKTHSEAKIREAIERAYKHGEVEDHGAAFATAVLKELTKPRLKPDRPVMYDHKAYFSPHNPVVCTTIGADKFDDSVSNIRPLFTEEEVKRVVRDLVECFVDVDEEEQATHWAMKRLHALCYEEDDS